VGTVNASTDAAPPMNDNDDDDVMTRSEVTASARAIHVNVIVIAIAIVLSIFTTDVVVVVLVVIVDVISFAFPSHTGTQFSTAVLLVQYNTVILGVLFQTMGMPFFVVSLGSWSFRRFHFI
jgi:hypothetical protein